ncbi:MAG: hypothetical protein U0894_17640 [Pirellulales bacterium]
MSDQQTDNTKNVDVDAAGGESADLQHTIMALEANLREANERILRGQAELKLSQADASRNGRRSPLCGPSDRAGFAFGRG